MFYKTLYGIQLFSLTEEAQILQEKLVFGFLKLSLSINVLIDN